MDRCGKNTQSRDEDSKKEEREHSGHVLDS